MRPLTASSPCPGRWSWPESEAPKIGSLKQRIARVEHGLRCAPISAARSEPDLRRPRSLGGETLRLAQPRHRPRASARGDTSAITTCLERLAALGDPRGERRPPTPPAPTTSTSCRTVLRTDTLRNVREAPGSMACCNGAGGSRILRRSRWRARSSTGLDERPCTQAGARVLGPPRPSWAGASWRWWCSPACCWR